MGGKLAIMQPYFFPYLGYFSLIHAVDHWVVFDTPQYIRKGWVNRNRVLSTGANEWKYLQIPTNKAPRNTPINQIWIAPHVDWRTDIQRKLDYYDIHSAPYFRQITEFLNASFCFDSLCLCDQLVHFLRSTCRLIGITPARFDILSQLNLKLGHVAHAGQWALRISESLGADTYINPVGGREIFQPADCGIR